MAPINWTDPTLLGSLSLSISILVAAIGLSRRLSRLSVRLEDADELSEPITSLSEKIDTVTNTYDMSALSDVRNDIRGINDSMDEVSAHVDEIDDISRSVDTIEASITNVSLTTMEEILEDIGGAFSDRNSVRYQMERSGIEAVISLTSIEEQEIEVRFRFSEPIEARTIAERMSGDKAFTEQEVDILGAETGVYSTSPRDLTFQVETDDMDAIAAWVERTVDQIDQLYTRLSEAQEEFDSKVEETLNDSSSGRDGA